MEKPVKELFFDKHFFRLPLRRSDRQNEEEEHMRNAWKRSLAMLMTLVMLLSLLPTAAFAEVDAAEELPDTREEILSIVPDEADALIKVEPAAEAVADKAANDGTHTVVGSGECGADGGNLTWTLYDDGELVISGTGAMASFMEGPNTTSAPWSDQVANRGAVSRVIIQSGVTNIGEGAFLECSALTSVTIPDSVTRIDNYAFTFCGALRSINLPEGLTSIGAEAFLSCSLTSITLPGGLTRILSGTFSYCRALTSITIPENVTSIEYAAFSDCSALTSVTLPADLMCIQSSAFSGCSSLTDVYFHNSERVRNEREGYYWATDGNNALFNANWHYSIAAVFDIVDNFDELKEIVDAYDGNEYYVYYNGRDTFVFEESITLPDKLYFCADAEGSAVQIPTGVSLIVSSRDKNAFYTENLVVEGSMTACRGAVVFRTLNGEINWLKTLLASGYCGAQGDNLTWTLYDDGSLVISGTGEMENYLLGSNPWWNYLDSILTVTVEPGVTGIGREGFVYLRNITSIALPEGLTSIGKYAFMGCSSLTELTLPAELMCIDAGAFQDCGALTDVYFDSSQRQRNEREGYYWATDGNAALFRANWHYGIATVFDTVDTFAELKAAVAAYDGRDTYVYYNGSDTFVFEESITLPEYFFFCADADNSSVRIPAGVILTAESGVTNAFYVENLVVEGTMNAYRNAVYYRTLTGEVNWLIRIIDSGSCGRELVWTLDSNGCLTISGNGNIEQGSWREKADLVRTVVIEEGVTGINSWAFEACRNMTSILLPEGLLRIDSGAFYGCSALAVLSIPASVTYFSRDALWGCSGLTELSVAAANEQYSSLDGVLFDKEQTQLLCFPAGRSGTYTVPDGVTSISSSAFSSCTGLTQIVLPEDLTRIENNAFGGCVGLTSLTIPEGVTSFGSQAFIFCSSLTSISLPSSLTDLGSQTFIGCSSLKSIRIPEGVGVIPSEAFYGCSSLTSVAIPSDVKRIDSGAFSGCSALSSIVLPEGLRFIENYAFANCSSLAAITLPANLMCIKASVFGGCDSLTDVYFDNSERVRNEREGYYWATDGNSALFRANWHYSIAAVFDTVDSFAELKAAVAAYDGSETYLYYNGSDTFVFEESITLPEKVFFCADADGSVARIPAGVTVTVTAMTANAFYVESLVVEGELFARRSAVYVGSLSGEVHWLPDAVDSGECGAQLSWTLFDNGELVISGTGKMYDYGPQASAWSSRSADILRVTIKPGAASVGNWAFGFCSNLTEVTLPEDVTSIGAHAFHSCGSLSDITIPDGVTSIGNCAFYGCGGLTQIVLPEGLTSIGNCAFSECAGFTSVLIPAGVTSIATDAFIGCSNLTAIEAAPGSSTFSSFGGVLFNKDMTELLICPCGKSGSYTVPKGITSIGREAFHGCGRLTQIVLPESLKSIDNSAFCECIGLTSVSIPAGVTSIASTAFLWCSNLTAIEVAPGNNTYSSLDGVLFNKAMTELLFCPYTKSGAYTVPAGVTKLSAEAFANCEDLTEVELPSGMTTISGYAFFGCGSLTRITIPNSVTTIEDWAFQFCESLTDVDYSGSEAQKEALIAKGWTTTGNDTLFNATWHYGNKPPVFDFILPAALQTIEEEALAGCAFRAVRIPDGAAEIGARAFAGSPNLVFVYIPASVTAIAADAFDQVTGLTIVGKAGSAAESFAGAHGFAFIAD